jgi:Transcriptional regulator/sugar kinase
MGRASAGELRPPPFADGRIGDGSLSKAVNRALLVGLLRRRGSASRAALAKESGLTKATVSSQVAELIELGLLRETGSGPSGVGRKPVMLEVDGSAGFLLGISISTEALRCVTMDLAGKTVRDEPLPIGDRSPATVVAAVAVAAARARKRHSRSRFGLCGVGVAVPGVVDRESGMVLRSAKLDWTDTPFEAELARRFHGELLVGNDATLATIAERSLCDPDADDFVCLFIDEGIGSGAFINGAVHYGHNGQFGEVGHMTIAHGGPRCPCGNYGCWDLYGSELALRTALGTARKGKAPGPEELLRLASSPPDWSRPAFSDFVGYLITGVVSIVNALAPSSIAINSAVLGASSELFAALKAGVEERTMSRSRGCAIRLSSLGRAAPAIGAAMGATERFYERLALGDRL